MNSNIILYTTDGGSVSVQVQYEDGTFWLTQKRMAELFGVEVNTINYHLKEIFKSSELQESSTIRKIRIVQTEGNRNVERELDFYHLDAIIAVGYRVNSKQATQFRICKLHWAITRKTAAEIIYDSADATKPHMGLTTWKHAPNGKIMKSDVTIAKNYLSEKHIKALNRIVSTYLDLAEDRAEREIPTTMNDWISVLNNFLTVAQYPILKDPGKISALEARLKAEQEYVIFRKIQDKTYLSDFDREIKRLKGK